MDQLKEMSEFDIKEMDKDFQRYKESMEEICSNPSWTQQDIPMIVSKLEN